MKALVDNDVLLKCAHYDLLHLLIEEMSPASETVGILGSARYVLGDVLQRLPSADPALVLARVLEFIARHETLEPTAEEQALAAEFETHALIANLALDPGESLLCAILVIRSAPLLITGDKRAIEAMEQMGELNTKMLDAHGRVRCLEQLVLMALTPETVDMIRTAICARPSVDKALFNCCGCSSTTSNLDGIVQGLDSYIRALRSKTANMLCR